MHIANEHSRRCATYGLGISTDISTGVFQATILIAAGPWCSGKRARPWPTQGSELRSRTNARSEAC